MVPKYILGQHSKLRETKTTEFKEFYLKIAPNIIFSERKSREILLTGLFSDELNNLVISNLQLYFKQYLPKYFASFVNSKVNGRLYFGIDDCGEITGIPCIHERISTSTISKCISNTNKYVKVGHGNNFLKNINIENFVDVKIHSVPLSLSKPITLPKVLEQSSSV